MISFSTKEMVPELSQLWYLCFHDEEPYRSFYYKNLFSAEDTLVYLADQKVAAMLTLLRAEQVIDGQKVPVRYVYAVATHPQHRRKGYAKSLLAYANQHCVDIPENKNDYCNTLLVPASKELFGYYEKLGYQTQYYLKIITVEREMDNDIMNQINSTALSAVEYDTIRTSYFYKNGNVLWSEKALEYMLKEICFVGGNAEKLTVNGQECAALYYAEDKQLIIKELAAPDAFILPVVWYLLAKTETESATVRLSCDSTLEGEVIPYGMAYNIAENERCYFNLSLD